jgi:hypothetical protein
VVVRQILGLPGQGSRRGPVRKVLPLPG